MECTAVTILFIKQVIFSAKNLFAGLVCKREILRFTFTMAASFFVSIHRRHKFLFCVSSLTQFSIASSLAEKEKAPLECGAF